MHYSSALMNCSSIWYTKPVYLRDVSFLKVNLSVIDWQVSPSFSLEKIVYNFHE